MKISPLILTASVLFCSAAGATQPNTIGPVGVTLTPILDTATTITGIPNLIRP
jgi:hypothetical protein